MRSPMCWIFTGASTLDDDEFERLDDELARLIDRGCFETGDEFVYGGANGVDSVCVSKMIRRFPTAEHTIYLPGAPYNLTATLRAADAGARLVPVPAKATRSASYMARNDAMVAHGRDYLTGGTATCLAFPHTAKEAARGVSAGTWATVRRARKAGIPVEVFPLNESSG